MKRNKYTSASSIFIVPWRFFLVAGVIAFIFCAVAARLYYLHVIMGPESLKVAEKARDRIEIIKARRGNITDARGNIVATSRPLIDLGVDQVDFKPTPENIKKLKMVAALLSMDEKTLI